MPAIYSQLYCPFPVSINPHMAAAHEHTLRWAARLHLFRLDALERLENRRYHLLTAQANPTASLENLQLITDWCAWLFALAEYCEHNGIGRSPTNLAGLHLTLLDILSGIAPRPPAEPLADGLWDIYTRLAARTSSEWLARFHDAVKKYFEANVWQATYSLQGLEPDSVIYRAMRPYTSAIYPCLQLIELMEAIKLPLSVLTHPDVQCLFHMANNVIALANDLAWHETDEPRQRQAGSRSLVLILARELSIPIKEAIAQVITLHNAEVRSFIVLAQHMPHFTPAVDRALSRYVAGMQCWMRANHDWPHGAAPERATSAAVVPESEYSL
jgi:hypothetical protein